MTRILPIKDFEKYLISDQGDVFSTNFNRMGFIKKLKQRKLPTGYYQVVLSKNGKRNRFRTHRLVAEAFIPNPKNKPEVNHKNGIRTDNRVENLEWMTRSENIRHAFNVLHRQASGKGMFGKNNKTSKTVLQIKNGAVVAEFFGCCEAQRKTGIKARSISAVCCGRRKRTGGFQWQYKQKEKENEKTNMDNGLVVE